MIPEDNKKQQDRKLEQLDYPDNEDIFLNEPHISLDGDGIPEEDAGSPAGDTVDQDVPGSELDDAQQLIGSEDEENNYWSIGGENHEDLEQTDD